MLSQKVHRPTKFILLSEVYFTDNMKTYWGAGGIIPRVMDLGTIWR